MKFFLSLIFLAFSLLASPFVEITSDNTKITDFKLSYLIDHTQKLHFKDIKSLEFQEGTNSDTLGATVTNTWIKIQLHNSTDKVKKLVLHQDFGFIFIYIHYFELNSDLKLVKEKEIDVVPPYAKEQMNGADATFSFTLLAHESKTIYVNQRTNAYHFYNYSILSDKNSIDYLIKEKIDSILFVGLLLTLIIYNFILYISSGYKEYLYYSTYLFFATFWIFYMYGGLAHYFQIYGEISFRFNFALMINPIFLALFIQTLFKTKSEFKTEHLFLNSIIFILSLNVIYSIFDFNSGLKLLSLILDYTLIVFMWVSISLYRKGVKLVKIFLLAHTFYLIFNIYALLFYMGLVDFNYISSHGIGIGIIIEGLMLAYLLSFKIKTIEIEKEQQRELKLQAIEEQSRAKLLLMQKTKMADMGEMVGNIAHQWKQPLTVIGLSVGILREKKLINRLSNKDFYEELELIDTNIVQMAQTVEDFLSYFKPNKNKNKFLLIDAVDKALLIIGNRVYKSDIKFTIKVDEEHKVYGLKEEYIQVLISIIQNAMDVLEGQDIKMIKISSFLCDKKTLLEIGDNGGGIKEELLERVFEPYFTTKHQMSGTGLGLYIAKEIIEKSMNGTLSVSNSDVGARFSIKI